jgi:hypothetical protein
MNRDGSMTMKGIAERNWLMRGPTWRLPTYLVAMALSVTPGVSPELRRLCSFVMGVVVGSAFHGGWWRR